jgi:hypothetical protein
VQDYKHIILTEVARILLLLLAGSMAVTMAVALSQDDPISTHASFTSLHGALEVGDKSGEILVVRAIFSCNSDSEQGGMMHQMREEILSVISKSQMTAVVRRAEVNDTVGQRTDSEKQADKASVKGRRDRRGITQQQWRGGQRSMVQ